MTVVVENPDVTEPLKPRRTPRQFFNKYFLHGQQLSNEVEVQLVSSNHDSFDYGIIDKYRNIFAFLIPFVVGQFVWWCLALRYDFLSLYSTHWHLPVTMVFGAIVAGMTAEGGGAVAFPVMTFILHTTPKAARDFSLMIQAIGMSLALFSLLFMKIQVEWRAISYALLGALPGFVFGYHVFDGLFNAPEKKMMFVSIWTAFAFSLYILNREKKRVTVPVIQCFCLWKAVALMGTGFIGGVFTSFAGSGVDICTFSIITLLFKVNEKTATPTTIVIMALVSQFSFFWKAVVTADIDPLALNYLKVTVPVAILFAPLGSYLGSHFHRLTLAWLVCILEIVAYAGFLATLPPWPLLLASAIILFIGFVFFSILSRVGHQLTQEEMNIDNPKVIIVPDKS